MIVDIVFVPKIPLSLTLSHKGRGINPSLDGRGQRGG
jgi:hypothetical protein